MSDIFGGVHVTTGAARTPAKPDITGSTPPSTAGSVGIDDTGYTAIIQSTLALYGLSSLADQVIQWGKTGATTDQINLQLQQTPEWKQRFAGNEQRIANGLAPLDPTSYIAYESQARQILNDLPAGFYDSKADIDSLIGGNVSASELSDKVQMANMIVNSASPEWQQAYTKYYGAAGAGGIVAAILDPTKAEPLVQQQVTAAQIGGTALQQGLKLTSSSTALKAAAQGVSLQQAQAAYQHIAGRIAGDRAAGNRFGSTQNQSTEESADLLGNAGAIRERALVGSEEGSLFGGHGASSAAANSAGLT